MRPRVTLTRGVRYRTPDGRIGVAAGQYRIRDCDFGRVHYLTYVLLEFDDGHSEPHNAATLRRVDEAGHG